MVNGTGVSKTFQILYRNEEVLLDDVIMFRAHILVDSHKVSTEPQDFDKSVFSIKVSKLRIRSLSNCFLLLVTRMIILVSQALAARCLVVHFTTLGY